MLFIKEDGAICVDDGQDLVVFPLMKEEIKLLIDDQNYFENYLNLKYEVGLDEDTKALFENKMPNIDDKNSDWWIDSIWAISSVKFRSIVGLIYFDREKAKTLKVHFLTARLFRRIGIMTKALSLVCDYAFENGIGKIVADISLDNEPAVKVLKNNDFTNKKSQNDIVTFERKK